MTVTLLPRRLTEQQAAVELLVSVDTIRRERRRGKLGYLRIGRRIFITEDHLRDYLQRQSVIPCPSENAMSKSVATGSASETTRPTGAVLGSIPLPDRLDAHLLAQATFNKPN